MLRGRRRKGSWFGVSQTGHCPFQPEPRTLPHLHQKKKPLPVIRRGFRQIRLERPLIFPAFPTGSARTRAGVSTRPSIQTSRRLLWRHRAQPSAILDKKRYSVVCDYLTPRRKRVNVISSRPRLDDTDTAAIPTWAGNHQGARGAGWTAIPHASRSPCGEDHGFARLGPTVGGRAGRRGRPWP